MEEEEFFNSLAKNKTGIMGVLTPLATGIFFLLRWVKVLISALKVLKSERLFETYNEKIDLVSVKKVTYIFKPLTMKRDSQDLFESMKYAYEVESVTNVDGKSISFKMYELNLADEILLSNVIKFLDYYRIKNGVKILIFIQSSRDEKEDLKKYLCDYIKKGNIRGAKIV